jgi:hypothetical protein
MPYLADAAIILLVGVALLVASWWVANPQRTFLENGVLGVGLLLGAGGSSIALLGFLISFSFGMWTLPLLAILFLLFLPLGVPLADKTRNFQQHARSVWSRLQNLRGFELILFLYLLFAFALTFILTLAPPNANDYDSLVYHLAAPQRYLDIGRIVELPYDHHTYFPFLTEMLFALGLQWRGPVLAKLFHWLMLPLCCMTLMAMGSRHFSRRAGLIAACLFASIPIVLIEATTAYVDLSLCAFVLLAFMCFTNWLESKENSWLLWSGAFCGFALGVKYSGALFFLWLLAWGMGAIFFNTKNTKNGHEDVSGEEQKKKSVSFVKPLWSLCCFAIIALLIGGGWYLRNILWTGNPVYPFAYEIFGGKGWTLEMAKGYTQDQASFGFGRGVLDLLLLPWRVAMAPLNLLIMTPQGVAILPQPFWPFSTTALDNSSAGRFETIGHVLQAMIGPHLLAFGLPLFFMRRKPALIGFLLWTFLLFWVFWFVTSQQIRYLLPTAALLCLCCGWGVLRLAARGPVLKWTCALTLGAWLLFAPAYVIHRMSDVFPVVLGTETPDVFLTRTFPGYEAMQWASTNTPNDARFAVYGEPRCFYLRRDYFWADDAHNNLIDYTRVTSGAQLIAALKAQGATHLLANTQAAQNGGFGGPPAQMESAVSRGLLKLLFEARGYRVYEFAGGATP